MKTAADYRIENIKKIIVNGKPKKAFHAYVRKAGALGNDVFVFDGAYMAPIKTANKNLWLIPSEGDTGSMD